jgi:hypothetical protein
MNTASQSVYTIINKFIYIVMIVGIGLVVIASAIAVQNNSSMNAIITGFSLISIATSILLFTTMYRNGATKMINDFTFNWSTWEKLKPMIINMLPSITIIGLSIWTAILLSSHRNIIVSNTIASMFYTYYMVSFVCMIAQIISLYKSSTASNEPRS